MDDGIIVWSGCKVPVGIMHEIEEDEGIATGELLRRDP